MCTDALNKAADPLFVKMSRSGTLCKGRILHRPTLANYEYIELPSNYFVTLNNYRRQNSEEARRHIINVRKLYKQCARKFRHEDDRQRTGNLLNARCENAKLYWKLISEARDSVCKSNIKVDA